MKKTIFVITMLLSSFLLQTATAQARANVNIGIQPLWGPDGYDHAAYYYFPDIDVFYNVPKRKYIYLQDNRWVFAEDLPSQYQKFDLYSSYKVVVNEKKPYRNAQKYREKYERFKGRLDQRIISNSRDSRYYANKEHPKHNKWIIDNERRNKEDKKRH
jgi:hypothetical protein